MGIGYVSVTDFAIQVERQRREAVCEHPLVLCENDRVAHACGRAATFGIQPGQPLSQAQHLCPQALIVPADEPRYAAAFDTVLGLLEQTTPLVEPLGLGRAYLDTFPDDAFAVGQAALRNICAHGLMARLGVAGNKFTAQLAASRLRDGQVLALPRGTEPRFLALFPLNVLPLSQDALHCLRWLGIRTVGEYAQLPVEVVLVNFGRAGELAHRLARGIDARPVVPRQEQPVYEATRSFDDPVETLAPVENVLSLLSADVSERLQADGQRARALALSLSFVDGSMHTERRTLSRPAGGKQRIQDLARTMLGRMRWPCGALGLSLTIQATIVEWAEQLYRFAAGADAPRRLARSVGHLHGRYPGRFYHACLAAPHALLASRRSARTPYVGTVGHDSPLSRAATHPGRS